jgi:hypothetical protein
MQTKKRTSRTFVKIIHRMNDDEKRLFRILFEHALPELDTKTEHTISQQELLKLWNPVHLNNSEPFLRRAFGNIGTSINYQCVANPDRPSWGMFGLFSSRGINEDGSYQYAYNNQIKRLLAMPIVYNQLLEENIIVPIPYQSTHAATPASGSAHMPSSDSVLSTIFGI